MSGYVSTSGQVGYNDLKLPGAWSRKIGKDLYEVFIGPQHPGSGHMRIIIRIDGDVIVEADPDMGYVHRTMEKLGEGRDWIKGIPLYERMAIHDSCNVTLPYVRAVEHLLDVDPPLRAKYLRVLLCEINRIAAYLYGFGIFGVFLGHSTMYMWPFGDREVWLELAEWLTGARLTHSYPVFGGVRRDVPAGFTDQLRKATKHMRMRLEEYRKIYVDNPVIRSRLEDVGVIPRNLAIEIGITGPNLRASGVLYDVRYNDPYEAYGELDFEIPVFQEGDSLARVWQRVEEIKQSLRILEQVADWLDSHPREQVLHDKYWKTAPQLWKEVFEKEGRAKLVPAYTLIKVPKGKSYARAETARGEITYYVESDGGQTPYRVRVVSASARNALVFKYILPGHRVMDLPTIYGSIDYFPPEADR